MVKKCIKVNIINFKKVITFIDLLPTICYNIIGNRVGNKTDRSHGLNDTRKKILSEMRHNPNITKQELSILIGISDTAIDNNIKYLKDNNYIKRIGSNKFGYWDVIK